METTAQTNPAPARAEAKLAADEEIRPLRVTIRLNYITPEQVTVEEGWYRLVVSDPHLLARRLSVDLEDDSQMKLISVERADATAKTTLVYKLTPGRRRIRIGNKPEWTVQIEVTAKKGK